MQLANELRRVRQSRGLTQLAVAAAAGTPLPYYIGIEKHGHLPTPGLRERIAGALGATEGDLWPDLPQAAEEGERAAAPHGG